MYAPLPRICCMATIRRTVTRVKNLFTCNRSFSADDENHVHYLAVLATSLPAPLHSVEPSVDNHSAAVMRVAPPAKKVSIELVSSHPYARKKLNMYIQHGQAIAHNIEGRLCCMTKLRHIIYRHPQHESPPW